MTVQAVEVLRPAAGLVDEPCEPVGDGRPDSNAPQETYNKPGVEEARVPLRSRVHNVTVLGLIAAVQVGWLGCLAYGIYVVAF